MHYPQERKYKYWEEINEAILRQIPLNNTGSEKTVLDVGCGTGALSEAVGKKGYSVWGIELNSEAAAICRQRANRVIPIDLTQLDAVHAEIGNQLFDYLIFADILEHLSDPLSILRHYLRYLKDNGYVLVSLPNVVSWMNRLMFLFGRFQYTDTGILDKDHLRFFTFKTAKLMLETAGCSIVKTDYIPYFTRAATPLIKKILLKDKGLDHGDHRLLMDLSSYRWYMKYVNPLEYFLGYFFKGLFAFKMIVVGRKGNY